MGDYAGEITLGVKVDDSGLNAQVEKAGKSAGSSFTDALKGAFSFAIGQNVFDFITNGFRNTIESAFDFDSAMQSTTTNFTTLLHSATKATSLVNQLNSIDIKSPLNMSELSSAAQEMLSFGVNVSDVIPDIRELSDVAMGDSSKFQALALVFSQTASAGKLTGQDLLQYVNAGFNPLQIIAQKTGKSMAELRTEMGKGQISAADVAGAFKTATSAGGKFYGATNNATHTFKGQMDMLKTSATETLGNMIKPAFNEISNNVLPRLNSVMDTVQSTFKSTGSVTDAVAAGLTSAFGPGVGNTFKTLATVIKDTFGWIVDHKPAVISAIVGIGGAFAAFSTASKATKIVGSISKGIEVMGKKGEEGFRAVNMFQRLGGAITLLKGAEKVPRDIGGAIKVMFGLPPQALLVIAAIGVLAALAFVIIKNWKTIGPFFTNLWNGVVNVTRPLWQAVQQTIVSVWNIIRPTIVSGLQTVQAWWNKVWPEIQQVFSTVWAVLRPVIGIILSIWKNEFSVVLNVLLSLWKSCWTTIKDVFKLVWDLAAGIIKTAWDYISGVIKFYLDLILGLFRIFKDIFTGNWSDLGAAVRSLARAMWHDVTGIMGNLFKDVGSIFGNLGKDAFSWGKDIINGLVNGIKGAAGAVKTAIGNVAQDIKSFLHFSEPDTGPLVGFHSWAPDMMRGLADDITGSQSLVTRAMQSVTSGMAVAIHPAAMLALAGISSGTRTQTVDNSRKRTVNYYGNQYFTDAGSKRANLQQLDILAGY